MNYDYISQNMRHVADMNNIKHESREKDIKYWFSQGRI